MTPNTWIRWIFLHDWARERHPDSAHPDRRRFTAAYRRKRGIVKNIWITSGLVMAIQASPAFIAALALGTTFLCLAILDETR